MKKQSPVDNNGGNNKPGVTKADKSGNNQPTVAQGTTAIVAWRPTDVVLQLDSDWSPTWLPDYGTHGSPQSSCSCRQFGP